jgi:hypothetical protein
MPYRPDRDRPLVAALLPPFHVSDEPALSMASVDLVFSSQAPVFPPLVIPGRTNRGLGLSQIPNTPGCSTLQNSN